MIRIGDFIMDEEHRKAIEDVLSSGRLTEGKYVKKVEKILEDFLGVKHAILVTNGTVALQLVSLYLTWLKKRTLKIMVPAMTFPATLNAFYITNHMCALCDVGKDLLIDLDSLSEKEKKELDVIVPVHLMGYSCNMDKIMKEAEIYNWIVVEDAAEAFGGEYSGKKLGTFGDFGTFSFYMSHNIMGGELGCVVTNDTKAASVMRSMKNHGRTGPNLIFNHDYPGSNYKTNEFCAAIAYANLLNVDKILKTRYENAKYFYDNIKNPKLEPLRCPIGFSPLGYPINAKTKEYRDYICEILNKNGIETRKMFPNLALQPAFRKIYGNNYPIATEMANKLFYIGVHHYLTDEEKKKIVGVLNEN
jgi:CDP-6-deoxy-D-xylo-4-hexulose-3-dehydrase